MQVLYFFFGATNNQVLFSSIIGRIVSIHNPTSYYMLKQQDAQQVD